MTSITKALCSECMGQLQEGYEEWSYCPWCGEYLEEEGKIIEQENIIDQVFKYGEIWTINFQDGKYHLSSSRSPLVVIAETEEKCLEKLPQIIEQEYQKYQSINPLELDKNKQSYVLWLKYIRDNVQKTIS